MAEQTPLYDQHLESGAKMVDFYGWLLPMNYGSQLEEHNHVRQDAGMFDVSHMTVTDFQGEETTDFLRTVLANDVAKLNSDGRALYTAMLNEQGGIIDDLIVYKINASHYRLVLNAATRDKDLAWLRQQAEALTVTITERKDLVNLAVQGPKAREKTAQVLPENIADEALGLKPFACLVEGDWQISRTGYTGEDGFEILLPEQHAAQFWQALLTQGVQPCGLGARDTLRLEAGLNLYGADMDETVTPLESNIGWTVAFEPADREFIGRQALEEQQQAGNHAALVGLLLEDKGVLRAGQSVFQNNQEIGVLTSGTFSPTLRRGVAFARLQGFESEQCEVEVRNKRLNARVVKLPFVRKGKVLVS